ncbi:glycosyltransferase [Verrucomicrobia bacterium S94]|nr:glycosyltransferase [Verrucomicrobia bacterium S94]
MIVVCDINEIWRRKPFAALAEIESVQGVAPADWMVARKRGLPDTDDSLDVLSVTLPPGWASRTSWLGQRMLWRRIRKCCPDVETLVVTSPHYLPMLDYISPKIRTIYYASDDYRNYEGWDAVVRLEEQLVKRVDHSFFVSEGLKNRAQREYGVDSGKLSVSMNATESRFFSEDPMEPVSAPLEGLKRPIAGIVGGINERLDFELLTACAQLPELGTLLLVGPLTGSSSSGLNKLLEQPKCSAVGRQPHNTIHRWFQCLDVGLIPYVESEFNQFCSPMRLFDHLASGAPVIATAACDQVHAFERHVVAAGNREQFIEALRKALSSGTRPGRIEGITWADRATSMAGVIKGLCHD